MKPSLFSSELEEVATRLSEEDVSLLPVMRGDTVVGIIGKRDVIRGMLMQESAD